MKIVITTIGTRGDLQPYIALGLGLKKAGYEVQIVSARNEENFVRNYGLDFYALEVDIQKIMEDGEVREMSKGNNPLKFIKGHLKSSKGLKKLMVKTQVEIWKACADADLIIFHPGMPLGFYLAGNAPIYIGFGSMKENESFSKTLEIIIEALNLTKQRAVVGLG